VTKIRFKSNNEFYEFVDHLSADLSELGFSQASAELHEILHETAWTTSSEVFGEIKLTLERLKAREGKTLPECLAQDIDACIATIKVAWNRANR
jgi:hypothetical protein